MPKKQRDIFLDSEGDAWYRRNLAGRGDDFDPDADPLTGEILRIASSMPQDNYAIRLLEIGCSDGSRLAWLQGQGLSCSGLDPSAAAVEAAVSHGVEAHRGTAEELPFESGAFDIVVFGFCLYLCDRDDLFTIAAEADRVLKAPGWMVIFDFYAPHPTENSYHHVDGVTTHKMDYTKPFVWHPAYTLFSTRVEGHSSGGYTDDESEWTAVSILRKRAVENPS